MIVGVRICFIICITLALLDLSIGDSRYLRTGEKHQNRELNGQTTSNHTNNNFFYFTDIHEKPASYYSTKNEENFVEGPFLGPTVGVKENSLHSAIPNDKNTKDAFERSDRIVGGVQATARSFYSLLLHHDGRGWKWAGCGATLISNCHVITAAHCVLDRDITVEGVYVNAHAPFDGNGGAPYHFSRVDHIETRDDYVDETNVADIAIIKMQRCVDNSQFPPAVPANPYYEVSDGTMLNIFGFGKMNENAESLNKVRTLRKADIPFISREACMADYYGENVLSDMVCAGFQEGGVDACQGDSGSGLMYTDHELGQTVFLGIVSWGVGCGRRGKPGVYSSIKYYYFWLWTEVCSDADTDPALPWCVLTDVQPVQENTQHIDETTVNARQTDFGLYATGCIHGASACESASDCCSGVCRSFPFENKKRCTPMIDQRPSIANTEGRGGTRGQSDRVFNGWN